MIVIFMNVRQRHYFETILMFHVKNEHISWMSCDQV